MRFWNDIGKFYSIHNDQGSFFGMNGKINNLYFKASNKYLLTNNNRFIYKKFMRLHTQFF